MTFRLPDSLQGVNLTKLTVGICLFFATILVIILVTTQSSGGVSKENQPLVLTQAARTSGVGNGNSSDDLTIVGLLGQGTDPSTEGSESQGPTVRIRRQGRVRGMTMKSREGRDYFAFYQIPYAADPVGELRFEPPQRPKRWSGIRDASHPGLGCLQKEKYAATNITGGTEACLHLNIYTPILPNRRNDVRLPVLFYLHGGGPQGNGTRYGAKYFMDEDVVLVTIEFRLGAFASFVTSSGSISGNQGFKDQVFALEWIQSNIEKFGGNPDNVMLFGNSGGSMAVHGHLLSTMSQGLYHRAVMQSGSTLKKPPVTIDPLKLSNILATAVGCQEPLVNGTESELLTCLRQIDAATIALSPWSLMTFGTYADPIDPDDENRLTRRNEIFMTDTTWNLAHQDINNVPLMLGLVSEENVGGEFSLMLTSENGTRELNQNWDEIVPKFIGIEDDPDHTMAHEFRALYFGNQTISNETRLNLFHFQSDSFMNHNCRTAGLLYANQSTAPPVYFYWMSKEPAKSYSKNVKDIFPPPYGPSHADELQYLFLYDGYPEIGLDSPWFNFSKIMIQTWASFADTGKPTPPGPHKWPPIDLRDNGMKWFQLGDQLGIVEPFTDRMTLWDKYTDELYGDN